MSTKTDVRADRIMKALLRAGDISVQELVDQVGTSAPSIRRDLNRLKKRGLVLRSHGAATLVEPLLLYEPFSHDTSFQARELRSADAERHIGVAASERIGEQETLTAGTTTAQIGRKSAVRLQRGARAARMGINA
jgi:DeoR family transcriptional regulator of aga operon